MSEDIQVVNEKTQHEFLLDNGEVGSRSAYIRQEFKKDRSRGEIAEELGVAYGTVYTATANLFNAKHPEGGGGAASNRGVIIKVPLVDEEGNPKLDENGEQLVESISRAEYMRRMLSAGKATRGELMKQFNVPYATVYAATKDIKIEGAEGKSGGKVVLTPEQCAAFGVPAGTSRVDFIRMKYQEFLDAGQEEGARRKIANMLAPCDYSTVWQATKDMGKDKEANTSAPAQDIATEPVEVSNPQTTVVADVLSATGLDEILD